MVVNFGSVKNTVAELAACLDTHNPDIVLGSETWLNQSVGDKEIFPDNYTVIGKDRKDTYGGVLIALKNDLIGAHRPDLDSNCEAVWAQVQLGATSKPNRRLTGGSVRYRAVVIV